MEAFTSLYVTRACASGGPIYLITMKYMGDEISPALVFTLIPKAQGYGVFTLPMFRGGVIETGGPSAFGDTRRGISIQLATSMNHASGSSPSEDDVSRPTDYPSP